jgi:hypothetical protein
MFTGVDATMDRMWLAIAFVVMAFIIRIAAGPELGRKPEAAVTTRPAEQPAMAR